MRPLIALGMSGEMEMSAHTPTFDHHDHEAMGSHYE